MSRVENTRHVRYCERKVSCSKNQGQPPRYDNHNSGEARGGGGGVMVGRLGTCLSMGAGQSVNGA